MPGEMEKPPSLKKNVAWTFLGNAVYNGCQWGIIVALAKLGSPEIVGRYSLAIALTTPAFLFSNMNLASILASDARNQNRFGEYLGLRLVLSVLCTLPIGIATVAGGYTGEVVTVIALVALAKFVESISDIALGLAQKHERMHVIARSMMMKGILTLGMVALGQWLTGDLVVAVVGQCAVWLGLLIFYDLRHARRLEPSRPMFALKVLAPLAWLSVPMGVVSALNSLNTQIPRYAMERLFGERELGIFSAIAALGMGAQMVTHAMSRSVLPRLSQLFARGDLPGFKKVLSRFMLIGAGVGVVSVIGAMVVGPAFLALAYTPEYSDQADVLVVVALAMGLNAALNFLGTAATAARRFRPQVVAHVVKVATITLATLLLVPRLGALGAAWTQVIGYSVSATIYGFIVIRILRHWHDAPATTGPSGPG